MVLEIHSKWGFMKRAGERNCKSEVRGERKVDRQTERKRDERKIKKAKCLFDLYII